jgi:hypothetical protein
VVNWQKRLQVRVTMERDNLKRITLFIPNEWFIQIQELCIIQKRSYSHYIRQAIYLKIIEDQLNDTSQQ